MTLVANATATSTASDDHVVTIKTIGNADVWPQYSDRTITHAAGVTTVGYLGGPFIIAAS